MIRLARYSWRNLAVRRLTAALTAGSMGLVVFVFSSVLMLAEGLEKSLVDTGSTNNAVFIRRSSETEVQSIIEREQAATLEALPEVAPGEDGKGFAAREIVVLIGLNKLGRSTPSNVIVRGVNPVNSFSLRPQVVFPADMGRALHAGTSEIVMGKSIAERFAVGGLGQTVSFAGMTWTVAGIMDTGGSGFDSEIWADADLVAAVFHRPVYSSVLVRLITPDSLNNLRERIAGDPRLTVEVRREKEYYASQSRIMAQFIRILGITLTIVFSLGAIVGSMVTMYAAVAGRISEIGTLRALGFGRTTVLAAFLREAVLMGLAGGCLGLAGASLMHHITISTMNWQTFSELSFRFTLTPSIAAKSMVFAGVMGVVGGMLPASRAARIGIVAALRAG